MINRELSQYAFFKKLKSLTFIKKIILFGSRARQDNKERSDIDLAIECPDVTDRQWQVILDIIDDADTLLNIDCVRLDTLDDQNPLKKAIEREGIILYQKGKI